MFVFEAVVLLAFVFSDQRPLSFLFFREHVASFLDTSLFGGRTWVRRIQLQLG